MKAQFRVTYAIVTPESAEQGDYDETGFVSEGCSLSEAVDLIGGSTAEADSSPISLSTPPRWFTQSEYDVNYSTGATESRSLHLPRNITPSSALRIARLLGVNVR